MPQISVILPVYNIKREYLTKAVESVLAQSFADFELLIVDDGSKKETADLCDELAAKDKRVTVFHNFNQGPGKSRNFGLAQAKGEFVIFMDHDDWVEKDWLKKLHHSIVKNKSDAAFCYADEYVEEDGVFQKWAAPHFDAEVFDMDDAMRNKMANVFFAPWAKLVRMEIIKKYHLMFAEDGNRFDDVLFHIFLNEYAARFSFVDEVLYHHRLFAASITGASSQNTDMYFDVFKTIESAAAKCAEEGISVKRIIDRNMNFFCSATDEIISRKEFIKKMRYYIKKFGLKDVLRKQRNRKIRHWLFTFDLKKGVIRILGIYLLNKQKK